MVTKMFETNHSNMPQSFSQKPEELDQFIEFFEEDKENIRRVKKLCEEKDLYVEFIIHGKAETVKESAENTRVDPKEIVKTLVFKSEESFVAVLCPGDTSVEEEKLEEILGSEVKMTSPSEVKKVTGYTIGGVSPFDLDIKTIMEKELLERDEVKPAAGSRVVGAKINPEALKKVINAQTFDVGR